MITPRASAIDPDGPPGPAPFREMEDCHEAVLEHLDLFQRLVDRTADGEVDPQSRLLASRIEDFFSSIARDHQAHEELQVFPILLAAGDAALAQAVLRLQRDHGFIEESWTEIAPQLRALAGGYHWYELDTLRPAARVFCERVQEHIQLEESMVYPASRILSVDVLARRARPIAG